MAEFRISAQVLADLNGFSATDREVDDDAVRMEALRLNTGVESARSASDTEGFFRRQFTLDVIDKDLILSDDQNLGFGFVFKFAQRHFVIFEELDQTIAGDAAILGTRDAVSLKATGVKPFADGARRDLADLGDLTSCKNLHFGLSDKIIRILFQRSFAPDTRSKPAFVERASVLLNEPAFNGVVLRLTKKSG